MWLHHWCSRKLKKLYMATCYAYINAKIMNRSDTAFELRLDKCSVVEISICSGVAFVYMLVPFHCKHSQHSASIFSIQRQFHVCYYHRVVQTHTHDDLVSLWGMLLTLPTNHDYSHQGHYRLVSTLYPAVA